MRETRVATSQSRGIEDAVRALRERGVGSPVATFVLGSGLSAAVAARDGVSVPFAEIPGFPRGRLEGHDRRLEFGTVESRPVLVLHGRAHYYEGFELREATFPVRVARALGSRWIGLLNAAGGLDPTHVPGDVVLITDHINLMGDNPLIGPNDDSLGPRFPDLSRAYDPGLRDLAEAAARRLDVPVRRGVYAAVTGPHYETAAELRMLRLLGADLVGMSTVPETIVAVHGGQRVLGISVVTDRADPDSLQPLSHDEVVRAAREAAPRVGGILCGVLAGEPA
ncbi:MAG: purine-nucleoside phosphorylase [Candidatus Eiseniibacteriota bacterium]